MGFPSADVPFCFSSLPGPERANSSCAEPPKSDSSSVRDRTFPDAVPDGLATQDQTRGRFSRSGLRAKLSSCETRMLLRRQVNFAWKPTRSSTWCWRTTSTPAAFAPRNFLTRWCSITANCFNSSPISGSSRCCENRSYSMSPRRDAARADMIVLAILQSQGLPVGTTLGQLTESVDVQVFCKQIDWPAMDSHFAVKITKPQPREEPWRHAPLPSPCAGQPRWWGLNE